MQGDPNELAKQLNAPAPVGYSFGREFAKSLIVVPDEEIYDDMSSPLPGLGIAPVGVVGVDS